MRTVAFLAALIIWAGSLRGQLDLLTPHEAERIVGQMPPVEEARKRWACLTVTGAVGNPADPATIDVEVRAPCSGNASSLIDRYVVDRRTGTVTTWGDNPSVIREPAAINLARQLVTQARGRVLSLEESRCLALEAAKSLPGWGRAMGSITAEQAGAGLPETVFWVRRQLVDPPAEFRVRLYVDPKMGRVQDVGSAAEVTSAGVGDLLSKLIALRFPPLLSNRDALSIAVALPDLAAASRRTGCSLVVSGADSSEEAQVALACNGRYVSGLGIAVDLQSGSLSDPWTGQALVVPEAVALARRLVSAVQEARAELRAEVSAKCGVSERPRDRR
jgi:hypothetical protein